MKKIEITEEFLLKNGFISYSIGIDGILRFHHPRLDGDFCLIDGQLTVTIQNTHLNIPWKYEYQVEQYYFLITNEYIETSTINEDNIKIDSLLDIDLSKYPDIKEHPNNFSIETAKYIIYNIKELKGERYPLINMSFDGGIMIEYFYFDKYYIFEIFNDQDIVYLERKNVFGSYIRKAYNLKIEDIDEFIERIEFEFDFM